MLLGDLFYPLLKKHVHVTHRKRVGISEIDLVLTAAPFTFAALDGNAGGGHAVADRAHQRLVSGRLHKVVIDPVIARRLQVSIAAGEGGMVRLIEKVEFQLTGAETRKALVADEIQLASEDR